MVLGASKVAALSAPNPHRFSSKVVREDEPVLVAAAKSGDAAAFEELVNRYERKIFRLTMNITRNREDAEDAMQDAFMKAYSHLNNFQEDSRFYTWLVRIAANEALMRLRKRRPNQVSLDEPVEGEDDLMPREIRGLGTQSRTALRAVRDAQDSGPGDRSTRSGLPHGLRFARHRRTFHRRNRGRPRNFGARREIQTTPCPLKAAPEARSLHAR